jgi:hypothetical protein
LKERPDIEKGRPRRKEKEMTEMALRSRIAVLVVAALLSIVGAFGTSAFLAAQDAQAAPYNPYGPCINPAAPWCK